MTFEVIQGHWKWHESIGHMILQTNDLKFVFRLFFFNFKTLIRFILIFYHIGLVAR